MVSAAEQPLVIRVSDWAAMPISGNSATTSGIPGYLSRLNFMQAEPGAAGRMWVCDLNGNLQIFDPNGSVASRSSQLLDQAKSRSAYLDFNGQSTTSENTEKAYVPNAAGTATGAQTPNGLFPLFTKKQGYANGLVTFEFDPGYATNGKFYTAHIETNSSDGTAGRVPVTTKFPGFNASGYTPTNRINPSGTVTRQAVLIEWTDTNRSNLTFEGTAREILRLGYNSHIHPLGDITFHPTAQPGDAEWGVMYLASGDGGSGESNTTRMNPQRLDQMVGKILRIIPDLSLHTADSSVSVNGRYRIPNDNPFVNAGTYPGARKEIWSVGHRNPHRFAWQVPTGGGVPTLLVTEIGLNSWEEVNIIKRGKNYGYSEREGAKKLTVSSSGAAIGSLPSPDTLPIRLSNIQNASGEFVPEYPVIAYPHTSDFGDAISNGFIYQGTKIPSLYGKFVFGDITTGRLFCCDWSAMLAADDGTPASFAAVQAITLEWDDPHDSPDEGVQPYSRLFEIVAAGYDARGGVDPDLPGTAPISGGRADIRLAVDAAGDLYVFSKSDGMIRSLATQLPPVFTQQPADKAIALGADTSFTAAASSNPAPAYQWQRLPAAGGPWQNVANGAVFSGATTPALALDSPDYASSGDLFRCVATCPGGEASSAAAALVLRAIPTSWLTTYFNASERADIAITGDMADPDRDGIVNLLEYAFAFDPEKDSSAVMPKIVKSGANITLTFPVPRASTMTYTVQRSTSLAAWVTTGITLSTTAGKTTATCPISLSPRGYFRVIAVPK